MMKSPLREFDGLPIRGLKDSQAGRVAFVLGNAPSIRTHDLDLLRGRCVIGMNASPALEDHYGFRCTHYTLSDARFLNHPEKRRFATTDLDLQTVRVLRRELRASDDPNWRARSYYPIALGKNGFSDDLERGFYFGCTTTMLAVQLAAYMGCRAVVLLGVDLKYDKEQPRFYRETVPQTSDPFLSVQIRNLRVTYLELRKRNVAMLICNRRSRLSPYVPCLPFGEAIGLKDEAVVPREWKRAT